MLTFARLLKISKAEAAGKLIYTGGDHIGTGTYTQPDMTFCGASAGEYRIIVPADADGDIMDIAESVRDHLRDTSGADLDVLPDSEPEVERELIIGYADRAECAQFKKEGYSIVSTDKKIMIAAASPAYYHAADDAFAEKLAEGGGVIPESLKLEVVDSALDFFLADNYAAGIVKDKANVAVQAMLSCLEYYNDRMVYGSTKLGEKWVYSIRGTYAKQTGTFEDQLNASNRGANCASPVNWALCEMGIVPKNDRFYGGSSGEFKSYSGNAETYLAPYVEVFDYHSSPVTFKTLYKQEKIKAGDILLCKRHTFVYRGDETFYAAGHDGAWHTDPTANTEDERKAVFDRWVLAFNEVSGSGEESSSSYNSNYNYNVYYIVRLRDDYIPAYYRNKDGTLVKNPMAD